MRVTFLVAAMLLPCLVAAEAAAPPSSGTPKQGANGPQETITLDEPKLKAATVPPTAEIRSSTNGLLETIDRRVTVLENRSAPAWYLAPLLAVLSTLIGATLGAVISVALMKRGEARDDKLRRTDTAIDVAAEWIAMLPKISHVNLCLENPGKLEDPQNLLAVKVYGNWLEVTAQRMAHDLVDSVLLEKMGIVDQMKIFVGRYEEAAKILAITNPGLDFRKNLSSWTGLVNRVTKQSGA